MAHPLVEQLRFTRSEWTRGLQDVDAEDARRRYGRLNAISWMIGHLAWHEQFYWFRLAQRPTPMPELAAYGFGKPASEPPPDEMWEAWRRITAMADPWLDALTTERMSDYLAGDVRREEDIGTRLLRINYHYWFHLGEALALRQLLAGESQQPLPEFVGSMAAAPWRPD
ncbi:MAG: DinB family protein [Anaerolineaceae bacterium]|nr:DinB family protein [Anaerolineaceae bacterium]MDE0327738.1 DinB family protein [Anaerolineaceae bacterium]